MAPNDVARWAVAAAFTGVLFWAADSDVRHRKIPNRSVLAILALFIPWAVLHWGYWDAWALAAGALALTIGVGLYALRMVGAGDAKLFAAVALFAGLGHLLALGMATALAGGAVAIVSLVARPHRAMTMIILQGKGDFGRGIPYGVAIAMAGAAVVWVTLLELPMPLSGAPL
jgi:prepilin peptidase CpaA